MLQKVDNKLVMIGSAPSSGEELGKAFSSANFQALGPKPAATQPAAAEQAPANPPPASTGFPAKP